MFVLHLQIWHTAVCVKMTRLDGGVITMQRPGEMNSAHRHARRWHHSKKSHFTAFFAGWSLSCLWLNTLACVWSFPFAKSSWTQIHSSTHREGWSSNLKTKENERTKIYPIKTADFNIYDGELVPERKKQHNQTHATSLGPLRCVCLSSRHVYVHSQSRCYSSLSVPSGPCTWGGRWWDGRTECWVDVKKTGDEIRHLYFEKMTWSGYWRTLKGLLR